MTEARSERFETFVNWYVRFNGYFTVPNFVVHAGDDSARISGNVIGNETEVDTIAIRLPYSREASGARFPIDKTLVEGADGRFDVALLEVKSGESNSPNRIWRNGETSHIEYVLRFVGWHDTDEKIATVARRLAEKFSFEEPGLRVRYIIFAEHCNPTWSGKGVKYVTFENCIRFISEERGQCWANAGIGRRSMHDQWNPLVRRLFQIANNALLSSAERQQEIRKLLDEG